MPKSKPASKHRRSRSEPSPYEERALLEIAEWKKPRASIFDLPGRLLAVGGEKAEDLMKSLPGGERAVESLKTQVAPAVDKLIESSVAGLISSLNDVALASVRPDAIVREFAKSGHDVEKRDDIYGLDLEHVVRTIGWLAAKYKGLALVEGGTTGAAGLPGIPVDIVALVGMCQRAIGEYATYTGFDIRTQQERLFAFNTLGLASSSSQRAKTAALAQLIRISRDVARRTTWRELEEYTFVQIAKRVAEAVGVRLTKAKLADMLPIAGGFVGAGFNTMFIGKVCDSAYFLYRERFLAEKYGPEFIAEVVAPASTLEPELEDD